MPISRITRTAGLSITKAHVTVKKSERDRRNPNDRAAENTPMKLSNLNPLWSQMLDNFTPETGGTPNGCFQLSFDCPTCGFPARIMIRVGAAIDGQLHQWKFSVPPNGAAWTDHLTIEPSINNSNGSHGRKAPSCSFHGSIIDGEVILK